MRAIQPVLEVAGVMVGGSQVPNLLQPDAASTLIVSQDVDLVIPVTRHEEVKEALGRIDRYRAAADEPSVWISDDPTLLEVNFIGLDSTLRDASDTYVLNDARLPLLVFGLLSHLREGELLHLEGVRARLPRPAGLLIEKLLTERAGLKGQRDLLVALGLILTSKAEDLDEAALIFAGLSNDQKKTAIGSLTLISLMPPIPEMPDPTEARPEIAALLKRLETIA